MTTAIGRLEVTKGSIAKWPPIHYSPRIMKTRFILFSALAVATLTSVADEYRTFTSTNGSQIRARFVKADEAGVHIIREDGQPFTFPVTALSAEDQTWVKQAAAAQASGYITKASPNDNLPPSELNELIGVPIFEDSVLWESPADEVAKRLRLRPESKTSRQSSFRAYPGEDAVMFGARPYSIALYAKSDKPTALSMVFANKGDLFGAKGSAEEHFDKDAPPAKAKQLLKEAMGKDVEAVTALLTQKLGEPERQRFGEGAGRDNVSRWDWRGHAILLREVDDEYVGIEVATAAFADAGGKFERTSDSDIRAMAAANVETRDNGDVVVGDIPMVDQGPKGYCVPATAERAMRYLGVPADMYVLAMAGNTGFGGGTSVSALLDGVGLDIRRKGRSFDNWRGEMKLRDIKKHIDKGVPIMWALYSTSEWNKTANERTQKRKDTTDWAAWADQMKAVSKSAELRKNTSTGHVVLIIGYNEETEEIAFSDSWGERYKERWMTIAEAECISQQGFWVVGF